jgi:hypothetical protein
VAIDLKTKKKLGYHHKNVDGDGNVYYYDYFGQLHRTDGPAIEYANEDKSWYMHGVHHRTDGPAIIWGDTGRKEWWVNGVELTEKQFNSKYGTGSSTISNGVKVEYEVKTVKVPKFVMIDGVKYSLTKES